MRGKYIIFESGEGGGKSTHAKLCVDYLNQNGINTVYSREPGSVAEAEKIRNVILDKENDLSSLTELYLFEAARAEFFRKVVLPNLENGISMVSDRSMYSSEAYQGYAGGVDLGLIKMLNEKSTFGIKPDLVVLINVNAEKGLAKETDSDRISDKGLNYHEKVNLGYLQIAKENPEIFKVIPYIENGLKEMKKMYFPKINELFGIF